MNNTQDDTSNDEILQAIDNAINNADADVCQKADLDNFDPRAQGDPLIERFYEHCFQSFDAEAANIADQIWENQDQSDLIAYASTCGWMYGYSCAKDKAKNEIATKETRITDLEDKLKDCKTALEQKKDEADQLRDDLEIKKKELRELSSETGGKFFPKLRRFKYFYLCISIPNVIAIAIIIDWLI